MIVEIGMQTHSNQQLVPNFIPCGGKSFVGVFFRGFWIFQVSREKNREFTRGNNFSRNSCTVHESNKNGSQMVVFVTQFAANFIEVQQCKKGSKLFLLDFCWREFVITGFNYRRSMKNLRNSRLSDPT